MLLTLSYLTPRLSSKSSQVAGLSSLRGSLLRWIHFFCLSSHVFGRAAIRFGWAAPFQPELLPLKLHPIGFDTQPSGNKNTKQVRGYSQESILCMLHARFSLVVYAGRHRQSRCQDPITQVWSGYLGLLDVQGIFPKTNPRFFDNRSPS